MLFALDDEEQVNPAVYFLSTEPANDDPTILQAIAINGQLVLALYSIKLVEWCGCTHSIEVEAVFGGVFVRPLWVLVCWE